MTDYISSQERVKEAENNAKIMLDNVVWYFSLFVIVFSLIVIVTN